MCFHFAAAILNLFMGIDFRTLMNHSLWRCFL